jgi:hypothetical protein
LLFLLALVLLSSFAAVGVVGSGARALLKSGGRLVELCGSVPSQQPQNLFFSIAMGWFQFPAGHHLLLLLEKGI